MEKIKSFQINHLLLNPGIYVSRKDKAGDAVLTTFDIRMTKCVSRARQDEGTR